MYSDHISAALFSYMMQEPVDTVCVYLWLCAELAHSVQESVSAALPYTEQNLLSTVMNFDD